MEKKLIYEVNNKKYLLFEIVRSDISLIEDLIDDAKDLGGIIQKYSVIKTGVFSSMAELSVLIPEEKALRFKC